MSTSLEALVDLVLAQVPNANLDRAGLRSTLAPAWNSRFHEGQRTAYQQVLAELQPESSLLVPDLDDVADLVRASLDALEDVETEPVAASLVPSAGGAFRTPIPSRVAGMDIVRVGRFFPGRVGEHDLAYVVTRRGDGDEREYRTYVLVHQDDREADAEWLLWHGEGFPSEAAAFDNMIQRERAHQATREDRGEAGGVTTGEVGMAGDRA